LQGLRGLWHIFLQRWIIAPGTQPRRFFCACMPNSLTLFGIVLAAVFLAVIIRIVVAAVWWRKGK
jgi:hypothetical protein